MAREIFIVNATVINGSGIYKIQAKGHNLTDWTDVSDEFEGLQNGTVIVGEGVNESIVNNNILTPGLTYDFRLLDLNNPLQTNVNAVKVPGYIGDLIATVDCEGALLTISFPDIILPEGDTLVLQAFINGSWQNAGDDLSNTPIDAPFQIPISNTGNGIPNGDYRIRFISNATEAVSNEVEFTIACPFERSINISNIGYNCDGTLNVNYEAINGYDGLVPVGFSNGNLFELQEFNGSSWVVIDMIATSGSSYEVILPHGGFPKLENGINIFRLAYNVEGTPCYSNEFELEVSCIEPHAPAALNFCLNVPSSPGVSPEDMTFKVTVDGVEYSVTGTSSDPALALHTGMRDALEANTQGFTLEGFVENGSETNYSYTLKAPAGSNETWNGKVVRVEVLDPLGIGYGNISVNTDGFGTLPGEGTFSGGY